MSSSAVAIYPTERRRSSGQGCDDFGADFFDQFLDFSPVDNEHFETPTYSLLNNSSTKHHSVDTGLCAGVTKDHAANHGSGAAKKEHCEVISPDSFSARGDHFYSELTGRAAISDSELLSLEHINLYSPKAHSHSQPSSPTASVATLTRKKHHLAESIEKRLRQEAAKLSERSSSQKVNKTPTVMQHQISSEVWGEDFGSPRSPYLDEEISPLSLPGPGNFPSSHAGHSTLKSREIRMEDSTGPFTYDHELYKHTPITSAGYQTPLTTPLLDHCRTSSLDRSSDGIGYPTTPQFDHPTSHWSQLPESRIDHFNTPRLYAATEDETPLWWSSSATAPMAHPLPTALHTNPQRGTKSLAHQLQSNVNYRPNKSAYLPTSRPTGLMIQMSGSPGPPPYMMGSSPPQHRDYYALSQPHYHSLSNKQYPHRRPHHSSPRKPSGSSDSDYPSPKSSPSARRKRKVHKARKHQSPRTPTTADAVDFVNYTPDDSRKILTGVAPSGSSKTKARREKEASEKRRKLSQAAIRAVRDAGGDVESLVQQGLLA